jgi:ubiquitin-protein ligase
MLLNNGYPAKAPEMKLISGQEFGNGYHHHIFGTKFCIDMLSNAIMDSNAACSGWNPAYSFTTLLLQI